MIKHKDVAPLDAEQGVTVLLTLGLCLLFFGILSLYKTLDSVVPSTSTPALFVLGGISLVGALVIHVGRHQ